MNDVSLQAFVDELMKISAPVQVAESAFKRLAPPVAAGALLGALGLNQLEKVKRRYDIGTAVENQQNQ